MAAGKVREAESYLYVAEVAAGRARVAERKRRRATMRKKSGMGKK